LPETPHNYTQINAKAWSPNNYWIQIEQQKQNQLIVNMETLLASTTKNINQNLLKTIFFENTHNATKTSSLQAIS